jgi:arylsulfatase A-like enzyme
MNIILITIDCLRADRFAIKGNRPEIAPYLNQLAKKGQFFINAFANGPYTYASFPSILTGTYALIHGGGEVLSPDIKTLAEFLSETGFDIFIEFPEWSSDETTLLTRKNDNDNSFLTKLLIRGKQSIVRNNSEPIGTGKLPYARGEKVNKQVAKIILQDKRNKPLFLWIHYMDLHVPFAPPLPILEKFLSSDLMLKNKHFYGPRSLVKNFREKDKDILSKIYDACLHYCDICIENLFEEILGPKMIKNSLVIITSDHGEAFYEHGLYGHKPALYDEVINVPLLIIAPGLRKGKIIDHCVSLIDVPKTISDFIGFDAPDEWLGKNIIKKRKNYHVENDNTVFSAYKLNKTILVSVRDKQWKLIFDKTGNNYVLFDTLSDPLEKRDVKSRYPEIAEKLMNKIESFLAMIRKNQKKSDTVTDSEEVKEKLKALGYM